MGFRSMFYICLVMLGMILFAGASKRHDDQEPFFDRILSKEIRGFLAVFIILHQTVITLVHFGVPHSVMNIFSSAFYYYGILAVAFFFFCSGFGLIRRYMTDENYIKDFMKRRIFTVLVPFFICNYIYLTEALLGNIRDGRHFGFGEVICSFFGLFLVNNQMWFAVEIMILYVAFRIVFAVVRKPAAGISIMTVIVLVMMAAGIVSGHSDSEVMSYWFKGEWWYNTILMFPAGMFYAYKEQQINKVIRNAFTAIVLASSVLFVLADYVHRILIEKMIYWTEYHGSDHPFLDKLLGLSEETVFELIFIILVITLLSRFKVDNPVLRFLGKISLEIIMINYLLNDNLFFLYVKYGIAVYLPAVIISTVVLASVLYLVKNIVLERRTGLFDGNAR